MENMTKEQAIAAMKAGHRVSHMYFAEDHPTTASGSVAAPKPDEKNELIREMVALFDVVRSDMIDIHEESPTGWTIIQINNIIEKGQSVLDKH